MPAFTGSSATFSPGATPANTSRKPCPAASPNRSTPVRAENLDPEAYFEYVDGKRRALAGPAREQSPAWILWTEKTIPGHAGLKFGDTPKPGPRHLVIGFKSPVPTSMIGPSPKFIPTRMARCNSWS